eukprot:gene4854-6437_t
MQALTASEARANLYRIIDETAASHEPIIISGKRANAVLLSAEDWNAIQETLYLLAVPGMRESIKAGMAEPLAKSAKALKDAKKLAASGLKPKAQELLAILATNPLQTPPPYEKLVGDLAGAYSRRLNIQHRTVDE